MFITSIILAILYLAIRFNFKNMINYSNASQEFLFISLGTTAICLSAIGQWVMPSLLSIWLGLIMGAAMLIQFPTIMKLKFKVISMIVTIALMVLICIPYIQWPAFIIAGLYFVYLGLKSHKKGAHLAIALMGILAIFSSFLDNIEFIYYGATLYFIIIHVAHTKQLLEMMKYAGKNVITDQLTGLYNRRWLYSKAQQLSAKQEIGIIFCDIDNFKQINDTKGHEFGDEVLKKSGEIMQREFRGHGFPARYGGEELVILVSDPKESVKLAERLLECLRKEVNITMSIGVVVGSGNAEELIKVADERMYMSKKSGKNRVTFENQAGM